MTVHATKAFSRFAGRAGLTEERLLEAAKAVIDGRSDADLGGAVFKQRVAREGGGKSGGFRTILAFRIGAHCFFVHGFAKNEKANVMPKELKALRKLADILLGMSVDEIEVAIAAGELRKVVNEDGNANEREG